MNKVSLYRKFLGLFIASERNLVLQAIQENYNLRIAEDGEFCTRISQLKLHSKIGSVFKGKQGESVLEVGCGPGRYAAMLAKLGLRVTAIDPFKFSDWENLSRIFEIDFQSEVYAEKLPLENNSFDHICCMGALLYFEDPEKALSEMHRVLKERGTLILRTVNLENNYTKNTGKKLDPSSKNLYTKPNLERLIEKAGFNIVESYTFGYWPSRYTDMFWYVYNCFISSNLKEKIGEFLPEENRILITIVAVKK